MKERDRRSARRAVQRVLVLNPMGRRLRGEICNSPSGQ